VGKNIPDALMGGRGELVNELLKCVLSREPLPHIQVGVHHRRPPYHNPLTMSFACLTAQSYTFEGEGGG
jgi:hypothetical protein